MAESKQEEDPSARSQKVHGLDMGQAVGAGAGGRVDSGRERLRTSRRRMERPSGRWPITPADVALAGSDKSVGSGKSDLTSHAEARTRVTHYCRGED